MKSDQFSKSAEILSDVCGQIHSISKISMANLAVVRIIFGKVYTICRRTGKGSG